MSIELLDNVITFICEYPRNTPPHLPLQGEALALKRAKALEINEFLAYWRTQKATNSESFQRLEETHPRIYWEGIRFRFPLLTPLALTVFSFPASTASTERSFSTNSFIHIQYII